MSATVALGWTAAAAGSALSIPQLVHTLRERTSAGMSLLMWQLNVAVGLGWTHHGLLTMTANIIAPNAVIALLSALILHLIVKDRGLRATAWLLPALLTVVLCGMDLLWGALVYGIATSIPQVVGAGAQLIDVVRRFDIRGISPVFLALGTLVQLLWLTWALIVGERAIVVAAISTGLVIGSTLLWWTLRRFGLARPLEQEPLVLETAEA